MTPEQFCYWLQGRAELQPDSIPTPEEWRMICEHLQTVFVKVTSPYPGIVKEGPNHRMVPQSPGIMAPVRWTTECKLGGNAIATATC